MQPYRVFKLALSGCKNGSTYSNLKIGDEMNTELKLVEVHGEKLTTTSLIIAELFGKKHFHVLRNIDKLIAKGRLDQSKIGLSEYKDSSGKNNKMYILDERSFLIAMPFIGGNKSEEGQVKLVDEFLRLQKLQNEPNRKAIRDETKVGFRWMNDNLKEMRESKGKQTASVHYMSEAKLINGVLTGNFSSVSRDSLSATDLQAIAELQRFNAKLIAQDIEYKTRKQELTALLSKRLTQT